MSEFVVAKYGGTSMANPGVVAGIVADRPDQHFVVVSAPGKDAEHDIKITDQLYTLAAAQKSGDKAAQVAVRDEVIDRFDSLYDQLDTTDRRELRTEAAQQLDYEPAHPAVYFPTVGENLSAQYFARLIDGDFIDSHWLRFDGANIDHASIYSALSLILSRRAAPRNTIVTPGFYGYDAQKERRLLGRGGSDRTGALAGGAFGRMYGDENVLYENWTDVDGIYSSDPRVVPGAIIVSELTRAEVREGAHAGSGVLQGNTIVDLNGSSVVTVVKNTFNPSAPGTRVLTERVTSRNDAIAAVAGRDDLVEVTIRDMGMADKPGYVAGLLNILGKQGLSIEHMPSSQDTFSITLHDDGTNMDKIEEFAEQARKLRLSSQGTVEVNERGVVYMIGEQLRIPEQSRAAMIRVLGTSATNDINIYDVVSNSSSPCLALLTDRGNVAALTRLVHAQEIERKNLLWS